MSDLYHIIADFQGIGEYETIIGHSIDRYTLKKLILVTIVKDETVDNYYKIILDNTIVGFALTLIDARKKYNNIGL